MGLPTPASVIRFAGRSSKYTSVIDEAAGPVFSNRNTTREERSVTLSFNCDAPAAQAAATLDDMHDEEKT